MNRNVLLIAKLELINRRKTILVWSLLLGIIMFVYMILFQSFKDALVAEMELMPPEILDMFGMSNEVDYTDYNNYYGMVSQMVLIVLCAFAVYIGSCTLGDEQSNKTIEYLNANSVKRSDIVIGKIFSVIIMLSIINVIQFALGVIPGFIVARDSINFWLLLKANLIGFVAVILFGVVGVTISTLLKNGKGGGIGLSVCFGTYIIGYFATLNIDWLKWCKWLSPMDYLSNALVISDNFGLGNIIALIITLLLIFAISLLSIFVFRKKDLL